MPKTTLAIVQCKVCKRIHDQGEYRLPWPGELGHRIKEVYCPRCAKETLRVIQSGAFAQHSQRLRERRAKSQTL